MVALFGYGLPGRVMSSPGVGMCPVGRVCGCPARLRACPVREVRARQRGCFLPGKRDLQDLTDLSDLSDIQDIQDR